MRAYVCAGARANIFRKIFKKRNLGDFNFMSTGKILTTSIMCPHCHAQYHPSEIFLPGSFTGKPENVIKDALGKILYEDYAPGDEPCLVEHFECEECGKPFIVEATVSYKTKEEAEELDFSSGMVSLL